MLESLVLDFEFAETPSLIDLFRVEPLAPAVIGSLTYSVFAATIADGEPLGSIAFDIAQETLDLVSGPSLAHESLPGLRQGDYHNSWTNFWGADHRPHPSKRCCNQEFQGSRRREQDRVTPAIFRASIGQERDG